MMRGESWSAGEYLDLYGTIAAQLQKVWDDQTRFSEEEKAQYFIGYLAKFPKSKESTEEQTESQNENLENV